MILAILFFILLSPLGGAIIYWENHVWFQYALTYWQCMMLYVPIALLAALLPAGRFLYSLALVATIFAQVIYWVGIINYLPIFHPIQ